MTARTTTRTVVERKFTRPPLEGVIADTGWCLARTSIVSRGILDYRREIRFRDDHAPAAVAAVIDEIQLHRSPGWFCWRAYESSPGTWQLSVTADSSD